MIVVITCAVPDRIGPTFLVREVIADSFCGLVKLEVLSARIEPRLATDASLDQIDPARDLPPAREISAEEMRFVPGSIVSRRGLCPTCHGDATITGPGNLTVACSNPSCPSTRSGTWVDCGRCGNPVHPGSACGVCELVAPR